MILTMVYFTKSKFILFSHIHKTTSSVPPWVFANGGINKLISKKRKMEKILYKFKDTEFGSFSKTIEMFQKNIDFFSDSDLRQRNLVKDCVNDFTDEMEKFMQKIAKITVQSELERFEAESVLYLEFTEIYEEYLRVLQDLACAREIESNYEIDRVNEIMNDEFEALWKRIEANDLPTDLFTPPEEIVSVKGESDSTDIHLTKRLNESLKIGS